MRLIDADALVSWLDIVPLENGLIDSDKIKQYISEMPDANGGWVSVKDRRPEKDQDVIIYGSWTGVSGTVYKETRFISMDEAIYEGFTPIAWMQLPEPPKE